METSELGLAKLLTLGRVPNILLAALRVLWAFVIDGLAVVLPVVLVVKEDEDELLDPPGKAVVVIGDDPDEDVNEVLEVVAVLPEDEEDEPIGDAELPATFRIMAWEALFPRESVARIKTG